MHHTLTGYGRERVLASLQLLARHGKLTELRLLHVPGKSDFLDASGELDADLAAFLQQLGPVPIRLNGFRHHGVRGGGAMARGSPNRAGTAGQPFACSGIGAGLTACLDGLSGCVIR